MRLSSYILAALFVLLLSTDVKAQDHPHTPNIYCAACRSLADFPQDARNFAYNQVWGPDSWMTVDDADRFQITDPSGLTVTIDMNAEYSYIVPDLDFGDLDPLLVESLIIQIRVIYENGEIVDYQFTNDDMSGTLPVGNANEPGYQSDGGASGGGSGGGGGGGWDGGAWYGGSGSGGGGCHTEFKDGEVVITCQRP